MGRVHLRDRVRLTIRHKTRDMTEIEQIKNFMVTHLYELYDYLEETEEFSSDWDFVQGSIETTQVYLHKIGADFLDHSSYIEKVEGAKWTAI